MEKQKLSPKKNKYYNSDAKKLLMFKLGEAEEKDKGIENHPLYNKLKNN